MGTMGDYEDIGLDLRVPKMSPDDQERCDSRTESEGDEQTTQAFLVQDGRKIKLERSESDPECENPRVIDDHHIDEVSDPPSEQYFDINLCYPEGDFYALGAHNDGSFDDSEVNAKTDDSATIFGDDSVIVLNSGRRLSGDGERRIQLRSLLDSRVNRGGKIEKVRVIKR